MTGVFSLCFCKIKRVFTLEMEIFLQKELLGVNAYIAKKMKMELTSPDLKAAIYFILTALKLQVRYVCAS